MEYVFIAVAALIASGLTFFSGFGLGTMLLPVFALFFPVEMAIGMTGVVHLLNNLLKLALLGKQADRQVVLRFGLPAIAAAVIGALLLVWFSGMSPWYTYSISGRAFQIEPVKAVIGILILIFLVLEWLPALKGLAIDRKFLPLGGVLSGFFGGLSGHQGAFRSMFLLKAGLEKESFIATGVIIASLVDISRLLVYSSKFERAFAEGYIGYLLVAITFAFIGVFAGSRLLKKVTMNLVQVIVSALLLIIGAGLLSGLI